MLVLFDFGVRHLMGFLFLAALWNFNSFLQDNAWIEETCLSTCLCSARTVSNLYMHYTIKKKKKILSSHILNDTWQFSNFPKQKVFWIKILNLIMLPDFQIGNCSETVRQAAGESKLICTSWSLFLGFRLATLSTLSLKCNALLVNV